MSAETTVLEPSQSLPDVPRRPAPWRLQGSGYVLMVRVPEALLGHEPAVSESLAPRRSGGHTAHVLCMDYHTANCGPYQQLLVVPGSFDFSPHGHYPTITRMFVSSYESVVNGRLNWGLPKDRAEFSRERLGEREERVTVSRNGSVFAQLHLQRYGITMPVHSGLIPAGLRTVMQPWQGKLYCVTLQAKGTLRMAKVLDWRFDPALFPDLAQGRVLAGAYLPRFELTFPEAVVRDWQG